jgi:hypothetical protein
VGVCVRCDNRSAPTSTQIVVEIEELEEVEQQREKIYEKTHAALERFGVGVGVSVAQRQRQRIAIALRQRQQERLQFGLGISQQQRERRAARRLEARAGAQRQGAAMTRSGYCG